MFVRNSFKLESRDQLGNVEESILGSKINLATSQLKPVLINKLNPSIVTKKVAKMVCFQDLKTKNFLADAR